MPLRRLRHRCDSRTEHVRSSPRWEAETSPPSATATFQGDVAHGAPRCKCAFATRSTRDSGLSMRSGRRHYRRTPATRRVMLRGARAKLCRCGECPAIHTSSKLVTAWSPVAARVVISVRSSSPPTRAAAATDAAVSVLGATPSALAPAALRPARAARVAAAGVRERRT